MKQILNGFADCYYLTEDGKVFNQANNKYLTMYEKHLYRLRTADGNYKKITLKSLYSMVYNKNFCIDNIQSIEGEEWRPVADTNNLYYVSNKGRIKSYKYYEAKLLQAYQSKKGYYRVDILTDGIRKNMLLHRIVAAAFLPMPCNMNYQIHHKDFNNTNNSADNLEWLSPLEHTKKHRERNELLKDADK